MWEVVEERKLANGKEFTSMKLTRKSAVGVGVPVDGVPRAFRNTTQDEVVAGFADGIRCDVDGNVWACAGWVGDGYDGVHVFEPVEGVRIGQIRLPEICSNVCFGGAKRNRLFMTASTSVYAVYVETRGAHIT